MVKTHNQLFIDGLAVKIDKHLATLSTACGAIEELARALEGEESNYASIAFMQVYAMEHICDSIEALRLEIIEAQSKYTRPTYPRYSLSKHKDKEIVVKTDSDGTQKFYVEASPSDIPKHLLPPSE